MTNYTPAQLEAWAGLGPWEWQKLAEFSSPKYSLGPGVLLTDERDGTPWGDTIDQTNAALIAAAPDLARLVLEKDAEIARLRFGLNGIANLIKTNIIENDGPNRFHLDGVSYEGPEVDAFFRILRGLEKIARQAMKETSDE